MSSFSNEEIEYPQGIKRNLEVFIQETRTFVNRHDYHAVKDRVIVLQNKACSIGSSELLDIARDLMKEINCPLPYLIQQSIFTPQPAQSAGILINRLEEGADEMPEYKRKGQPQGVRLNKEAKVKSMMTQLIHLTWKMGWYQNDNDESITIYDVNHWYGIMLKEDFNGESGNLSALYKGGNWKGIIKAMNSCVQTQEELELSSVIESAAKKEHEKRNP